ncbi:MAG: hypothetical protein JNK49_12815 [Planctomycetes bacterium]|nr:hypothetical protein [Planctomycetota bacterium]
MKLRRLVAGSLLLALGACAVPKYAQFAPLPADVPTMRIERAGFSILVPQHWREFGPSGSDALHFVEDAPANGRIRAYRSLAVYPGPTVAGDDLNAWLAAGTAALCELRARDGLAVAEWGVALLAGRPSAFVRGTVAPSSEDVVLETRVYLVPTASRSLVVEFQVPEGQLAAAEPGIAAMVQSLATSLPPPPFAAEPQWFDGGRFGVVVPDGCQVVAGAGLATLLFASGGQCHVSTATRAAGWDLAAAARAEVAEHAAAWLDWRVVRTDRGTRQGHAMLRLQGVYRGPQGPVVVDLGLYAAGERLDRVLCEVPLSAWTEARPAVERAVASVRWR